MSKGRLRPEDEVSIQQNYVFLKENLDALDLVDYLYQCGVITTHDKEQIYSEKIKKHRNEILLNILLNSGAGDSFKIFLKSLEAQYQSVLQRLLEEGGTLKHRTYQGQGDTTLKRKNDTLLEALAVEKEKNMKLNIEIDGLKKSFEHKKQTIEFLKGENVSLKKERRCLACRKQALPMEIEDSEDNKADEYRNFSNGIYSETLQEFTCDQTGSSKNKCDTLCRHIIGQPDQQITKNGEIGALMCKALCKKNPGHVNFIDIDKFSIEHLPEGYKTVDMFEYVKSVADLTVKISVSQTSVFRPKHWVETLFPYPLYDIRGKDYIRTGSGIIYDLEEKTDEICPCSKCKLSDEPNRLWWKIHIATANNLVYDNYEAKQTTATLFYDKERSSTTTLNEIVDITTTDRNDECSLRFVTCNKSEKGKFCQLGEKIKKYRDLRELIFIYHPLPKIQLVFIVSHPHGCSKMLSLGHLKHKLTIDRRPLESVTKYTYTATTCPGSVGAKVNVISNAQTFIHCGGLRSGLNYSSQKGKDDYPFQSSYKNQCLPKYMQK